MTWWTWSNRPCEARIVVCWRCNTCRRAVYIANQIPFCPFVSTGEDADLLGHFSPSFSKDNGRHKKKRRKRRGFKDLLFLCLSVHWKAANRTWLDYRRGKEELERRLGSSGFANYNEAHSPVVYIVDERERERSPSAFSLCLQYSEYTHMDILSFPFIQ